MNEYFTCSASFASTVIGIVAFTVFGLKGLLRLNTHPLAVYNFALLGSLFCTGVIQLFVRADVKMFMERCISQRQTCHMSYKN